MRPSGRALAAAAILVAWGVALALYARRVHFAPEPERLARAARRLPPGDAWYALFRGPERAGWASWRLDTLAAGRGFVLRERVVREEPGLGSRGLTESDLVAWLGPDAGLDSLEARTVAGTDTAWTRARVEPDGGLVLGDGARRAAPESPQLAASWPLRFAADPRAHREGRILAVTLFDPVTRALRDVSLRVGAAAERAWPDSADTGPDGAWAPVREDTVRAWPLTRVEGSVELATWVDEDGRVLEAELPGGVRAERTAFELAFLAGREDRASGGREAGP
jgi:hypothetical protein